MAKKRELAATRASRRYEARILKAGGQRLTLILKAPIAAKLESLKAGRSKVATIADLIARA